MSVRDLPAASVPRCAGDVNAREVVRWLSLGRQSPKIQRGKQTIVGKKAE